MNRTSKYYGWNPDRPDWRDPKFAFKPKVRRLADRVDLRETGNLPPIYDQLTIGACTANAIAAAYDFAHASEGLGFINPSRLFIYANERIMEGTDLTNDGGAQIRDGVKCVSTMGVCPETEWPYIESQFSIAPPKECYEAALKDLVLEYQSVGQREIMVALNQSKPVIMGFTVFESFESPDVARTGIVPMPLVNESVVGGHAVLCVGYDLEKGVYIIRNSWGSDWGQAGYFTLPHSYVEDENMASDFWVFSKVE
jgi:C1A family cysteine protease